MRRKTKIGVNVLQGWTNWCANSQLERSKVKVKGVKNILKMTQIARQYLLTPGGLRARWLDDRITRSGGFSARCTLSAVQWATAVKKSKDVYSS